MKAGDIAALITAGFAQPTGPEDAAWHTGQIVTWDDLSGVNTVNVNGVVLSNLKVIQSGIGLSYSAGDVVVVMRKQTQYFIMGKVASPGTGAANQIQSQTVAANQATTNTSYGDLASYGPEVSVNIGSSRRCLLLFSANILSLANAGTPTGIYIGGTAAVQVSGASTLSPGTPYCGGQVWYASTAAPQGFQMVSSQVALLTSSNGLNQGLNTFTLKYRAIATNPGANFVDRNLTVIPF